MLAVSSSLVFFKQVLLVFLCVASCPTLASNSTISGRATVAATVPRKYFVFGLPFSGVEYVERLLAAANISNSVLSAACSTIRKTNDSKNNIRSSSNDELHKIINAWKFEPFGWNDFKENNCSINEETLFIMVTKDPFAWLSSVARRRYNTKRAMRMHMRALVNAKWDDKAFRQHKAADHTSSSKRKSTKKKKPQRRYKTIMAKRTIIMQSHYRFLLRTKHNAIVRYEDLVADLSGAMKSIFRGHGIILGNVSFVDVLTTQTMIKDQNGYKHQIEEPFENHRYYTEKEYLSLFDERMMVGVVNGLNKRLEKKFGYSVPSAASNITDQRRKAKTILGSIWNVCMTILWWIVVPTVTLVVFFSVLVAWMKVEMFMRASAVTQKKDE